MVSLKVVDWKVVDLLVGDLQGVNVNGCVRKYIDQEVPKIKVVNLKVVDWIEDAMVTESLF